MLLSEIILIAESHSSYEFSLNSQDKLIDSLCSSSRIFRQGSTITLPVEKTVLHTNGHDKHIEMTTRGSDDLVYHFRVLMTEPTLQGFARPDTTRFVVIPDAEEPETWFANGDTSSPPDSEATSTSLSESDIEALEIDENFLASGLIGLTPQGTDLFSPNGTSDDVSYEPNGLRNPFSTDLWQPMSVSSSQMFQAAPFSAPIPQSPEPFDAECCVFLRTSDLSRVGMFNGDWVRLSWPHAFHDEAVHNSL